VAVAVGLEHDRVESRPVHVGRDHDGAACAGGVGDALEGLTGGLSCGEHGNVIDLTRAQARCAGTADPPLLNPGAGSGVPLRSQARRKPGRPGPLRSHRRRTGYRRMASTPLGAACGGVAADELADAKGGVAFRILWATATGYSCPCRV
jgi:hypothetical protein